MLNAVCHRDYTNQGSVFIRQYPKLLEIESPGGFPNGINPENIIYRQFPRNRRVAEVFQKCGLVERSGQGADKIFRLSIEEAKPQPDYSMSDSFSVKLKIHGEIRDVNFLKFLEKTSEEKQISWSLKDLIVLDDINQGKHPSSDYQESIQRLLSLEIIEKTGKGRATKIILSKRFYSFIEKRGKYTREKGFDIEEKKLLLIKHLEHYGKGTNIEFQDAIPSSNRENIKYLLKLLKDEGKITYIGNRKQGYWVLK